MANDDEELDGILMNAFETLAIQTPRTVDFDEFMSNPNIKLVFSF